MDSIATSRVNVDPFIGTIRKCEQTTLATCDYPAGIYRSETDTRACQRETRLVTDTVYNLDQWLT